MLGFTLISTDAYTAPSCRSLTEALRPKDVLDAAKLRQHKFKIGPNNELIDLKDNEVIGTLAVMTPSHLYEWADLDYQKIWVANGEISTANMREIYLENAQAYGKGYYVSTNPFDSSGYGDGLTVFKTNGPIVRLNNISHEGKCDQPDFLDRLQLAGIDAFGATETWLSMISVRHLKVEKNKISDPVWNDTNNLIWFLFHREKLVKSKLIAQLPSQFPSTDLKVKKYFVKLIDDYTQFNPTEYYKIRSLTSHITGPLKSEILNKLFEKHYRMIQSLSEVEFNSNIQKALRLNDFDLIVRLMSDGHQINPQYSGKTLLMLAANSGSALAVQALIKQHVDLNALAEDKKSTALMFAAAEGHFDAVKLLVEAGCDINIKNREGRSALHFARTHSKTDIINYLASKGAL